MGSTKIAIEIDGEAICLGSDDEAMDDAPGKEGEQGKEQPHQHFVGELEKINSPTIIEGGKEFTKDLLGSVVNSEEEAYRLYCDYAIRMGFSIRKGKQRYYTGTKKVYTKDYYCSKEGHKEDELPTDIIFSRPDTRPDARTNCKAMVRYKVDSQGRWKVVRLITEHNHGLARPEERHLLRCARSLAEVKHGVLSLVKSSNLVQSSGLTSTVETIPIETVGVESTMEGCSTSAQGKVLIDPEDCRLLTSYFKCKSREEGMFYWDAQVNCEGWISNVFWRDGRSRIDYDCFGDVVVLDTMCRMSKYNAMLVAFLGVNHHWLNVAFGCAFLSDDSAESYEWLLRTFLESMGGLAPKTIITGQNQFLSEAVAIVFPSTCHCFPHWDIHRSLQSHLGDLVSCKPLLDTITRCIAGCDSESEFEGVWKTMHTDYNLKNYSYISDLYDSRHKWCRAFHKDAFDCGINSPDSNQNFVDVLSGIADESASLMQLAVGFDDLARSWRLTELEQDFRCSQGIPECAIRHTILKHAAEVYTLTMYKLFERDFLDGYRLISYQEYSCGGTLFKFEMIMQGSPSKVHIVLVNTASMEVSCDCKKFETTGLLCTHAVNALALKSVNVIPERYVLKRWTRDAKCRLYPFNQEELSHLESSEAETAFRNRAMRFMFDLVTKSKSHPESRKILLDTLVGGEKALGNLFEMKSLLLHPSKRDKFGNRIERRKNKKRKERGTSRKGKPQQEAASADLVLAAPSTDNNQFYSVDETTNNPAFGRPFFYQPYPTTGTSSSQVYGNPDVHAIPRCSSSQDYSAFSNMPPNMPPSSSAFNGDRNI